MKGFKEFIMRGNLIELAVAFIMGTAFAAVVTTFTQIIIDLIGKLGNIDAFSTTAVAGINIGAFITAVLTFLITSFVLYFAIVKPYNAFKERKAAKEGTTEDDLEKSTEDLLVEIRDLLAGPAAAASVEAAPAPQQNPQNSTN
ncbi:large conductance mechanosensitive channel protein MscL [Parenemella sanctibonifatiensis]|uniref:Mechanosensitive ion channel protein MscL n=1 Tax=Parenemella sanctibonifatiensis TaxID=2016505 RepID=A0A255EB25_9ACTN|nr:large conductance mechanosensitive channel protein MscL [Parenemella sanctibonifatiensis]OYN88450.1 mechanosensitive ion channel protein MscL [Parenemella sanctibonifatiensis]